MAFVLDRFEDKLAVLVSLESEEEMNLNRSLLPKEAKEGDVLRQVNSDWIIDKEESLKRKRLIEEKFNSLWD